MRANATLFCLLFAVTSAKNPCAGTDWVPDFNEPPVRCFHPYKYKKPFLDAMQYCQEQGGNLATITSGFDNAHIYDLASSHDEVCDAWIGLQDLDSPGDFYWLDGDSSTYRRFAAGYPIKTDSSTVVFMQITQQKSTWKNTLAMETANCFVCERPASYHPPTHTPKTVAPATTTRAARTTVEQTTTTAPTTVHATTHSLTTLTPTVPSTTGAAATTTAPASTKQTPTTTVNPRPTNTVITTTVLPPSAYRDCLDIQRFRHAARSGVYYVEALGTTVYCDMETDGGGWTYILRRVDTSDGFVQTTVADYDRMIGMTGSSHWQSLSVISQLTASPSELIVETVGERDRGDGITKRSQRYSSFSVSSSWKLSVSPAEAGGSLSCQGFDLHDAADGATFAIDEKHGAWWVSDLSTRQPMLPLGLSSATLTEGLYFETSDSTGCRLIRPVQFGLKVRRTD